MYSLHLRCAQAEAEEISAALWDEGTVGIREEERGDQVELIAGFDDGVPREALAAKFAEFGPEWAREDDTDWVLATQRAWPGREVGTRIFLAPVWNSDLTPAGRVRIIHNPGLASGTGEHPCTQLALESLEKCVTPGAVVVDVGTGSGILSIAARQLGARVAVGLDTDWMSLVIARENFSLNQLDVTVASGSAACVSDESVDVVVANISATVLLSIGDELLRILRPGGWLVLTGFPESELHAIEVYFDTGPVTEMNEWRCVSCRPR